MVVFDYPSPYSIHPYRSASTTSTNINVTRTDLVFDYTFTDFFIVAVEDKRNVAASDDFDHPGQEFLDWEEEEEELPIKIVYPRLDFKFKPKKAVSKPNHVSIHKQAVFMKFITSRGK